MRLINKNIFIAIFSINLLVFISTPFNNYNIFIIIIVAFSMFLKDEYYTFNSFFYFFICSQIYRAIIGVILGAITYNLNYLKNINEWLSLAVIIFMILYLLVGDTFTLAFLYQFFRKKSYKKELEKAKKLLEESSISQEEFGIINKNLSTAK